MRAIFVSLFLFALPACVADDLAAKLQAVSVTIHAESAQGSGVVFNRSNESFVLTAAHVIDGLRTVRERLDGATGQTRKLPEFKPALVVKELIEDGRSVGKLQIEANVVAYSSVDWGQDLALLHIKKREFIKESARFYTGADIPSIGTSLSHVGSLLGQMGSNSYTTGVLSQHGRIRNGRVFDQTTCAAFPGSSGGGVFNPAGEYVGMITRGAGETFNLIVPVRRIRQWAEEHALSFLFDESKPVDLKAIKLENLEPVEKGSGGHEESAEERTLERR